LRWDSLTTSSPAKPLTSSRYDLLGASLEQLRQDVSDVRFDAGGRADGKTSIWWQALAYRRNPGGPGNAVAIADPTVRFEANPRITKPMTSEAMAKAMPILLPNCSQFIVEYAGDFVTQNNEQFLPAPPPNVINPDWGEVTGLEPDGVVDYVVDYTNNTAGNSIRSARIRWYGLPRDTNNDRRIIGYAAMPPAPRAIGGDGNQFAGSTNSNEMVDVVPLWDVRRTLVAGAEPEAHEREIPNDPDGAGYDIPGDYASLTTGGAAEPFFRYTCVWSNSSPSMIRIVLKLEDPAGRLPDGQWFEYVLGAP
jgi:hypothetical protein